MTLAELLKDLESRAEKADIGSWEVSPVNGNACQFSIRELAIKILNWQQNGKSEAVAAKLLKQTNDTSDYLTLANPANILALLRYVKGLEDCLEFYAQEENWHYSGECKMVISSIDTEGKNFLGGRAARQALALRVEEVK